MKKILVSFALISSICLLGGCSKEVGTEKNVEAKADAQASVDWPKEDITLLIPGSAGGAGDLCARALFPYVEEILGTDIVIENISGSNGAICYSQFCLDTEADGYTMCFFPFPGIATQEIANAECQFGLDDVVAAGGIAVDPNVICVSANSEIKTLEDFVNYAKEHPGELSVATGAVAGDDNIALTDLCTKADIEVTYVIYNGGAADRMAPLLGGHVDAAVWNGSDCAALGDEITVLGVMDTERYFALPDVPTFAEQGYDISDGALRGVCFPAGTDEAIVKKMSDAIGQALSDPECLEHMEKSGIQVKYEDYLTYDKTQRTKQAEFKETYVPAD